MLCNSNHVLDNFSEYSISHTSERLPDSYSDILHCKCRFDRVDADMHTGFKRIDLKGQIMKKEVVEVCPHCMRENIFKDWDIDSQGYMAKCQHCGHSIMLCDECMHADDNPKHICDWQDGF